MKEVKSPGTYLKWKGELVQVVGIATGKVIFMQPINAQPCSTCGRTPEYDALETSPLFQENAEPIETLKD